MRKEIFLLVIIHIFAFYLRFLNFDVSPPGFYSDEANQGYNAYSLLKTGKDEHGQFLPVSLRSFGDWKPPMQTYLAIPFISLFGLSEYAVRLPSMILGMLSIYIAFYLLKELGFKTKISLLTSFFLSISPWHLHQSRSAMLVIIAFFFFLVGILFFLKGLKNGRSLALSAFSFGLSIYAYYGMRLIVPLFIAFLFFYSKRRVRNLKTSFIIFIFVLFITLLPLGVAFIGEPNVIFGRAKTVSIFYDRGIELRIWELTAQEGSGNVLVARFFHNKLYLYFLDILKRFFSHLEGEFLFLKGDTVPPFRIPDMGVMYLLDSIFLLLGFWFLVNGVNEERTSFLLVLLAVSIFPAALTFMTPSANRTFNAVFPLTFLASLGVVSLINAVKRRWWRTLIVPLIILGYTLQFSAYLNDYYRVLPKSYSDDWIYGIKEMVRLVQKEEDNYDQIVVLPKTNIAYIYFLFYSDEEPLYLATKIRRNYTADEFGFEHVDRMGKYIFLRKGTLEEAQRKFSGKTLFVGKPEEIPESKVSLYNVMYPNGEIAFRLVEGG